MNNNMITISHSPSRPWPAWPRLAGLLLALGLLDCLGAWTLLYVDTLITNYAYAHGISNALGLNIWVIAIGSAGGIILHLVALQRTALRRQRVRAAILLASALWLTWLCWLAGAISAYFTSIGDIFRALPGH